MNEPCLDILLSIFVCFLVGLSVTSLNKNLQHEKKIPIAVASAYSTVTPIRLMKPPKSTSVCSFHSVLPQDNLELNLLRSSIAWPEAPPLPSNFFLNDTSDPAHSTFTILPRKDGGSWHIGDQLEVLIKMNDFLGRPKKSGGDVLFARLRNPNVRAGVAGRVSDHGNGSYTAVFPLLWEGRAQVEVTLVHPSEAVTVLRKLNLEQPDRIYFQSIFRSGRVSETTTCNVCLKAPKEKLCNFTDPYTGEPWFCYKPKKLNCDSRLTHAKGGLSNITISPKPQGTTHFLPETNQSIKTKPAGYYYQGVWRALDGTRVLQFNTSTAVSQCLKGKVLHLYGDSTIRQWFEYLTESLPGLKKFDLKTPKQNGPFLALDPENNILVTFRCHGPPIRFGTMPANQARYIASELDSVIGGKDTVVVIGVWSHFSTFPIEVYIRRLLSIRRAVVRLLTKAPGTVVIIRTANPKALTVYETLTNSDWYSLQRDKVLREIFKGVNVQLVDAWEMTIAHHLPHSLHPQLPIIKNMIDVILSHTCRMETRGK
uniref:Neurexophilin and PC-esterase domain family member 3 n=1 Tax=Poecilia latipinna TaxID=48699 RepID=A0A3B3VXL7_9TELE